MSQRQYEEMNRTNALAKEGKINENASIRDQHSTIIKAPIQHVWDILTNLSDWPSLFKEIKSMKVEGEIKEGTTFSWTLGRYKANSEIQKYDMPNLLTWTGKSNWVKRIYVWSLEADEDQTIVTVSTSLQGVFTVMVENHHKVYRELINWLEALKIKAEEG